MKPNDPQNFRAGKSSRKNNGSYLILDYLKSWRRAALVVCCLMLAFGVTWFSVRSAAQTGGARVAAGQRTMSTNLFPVFGERDTRSPFRRWLDARRRPGAPGSAALAPPQTEDEFEGNSEERRNWFSFQRTFPNDKIPLGARRLAAAQRRRMTMFKGGDPTRNVAETFAWNSIGPTRTIANYYDQIGLTSGRINSIAVAPDNDQLILVGSATGGIWRSTNGGTSFAPVSDDHVDLAIASIAFAPSNPSIVYAALGDNGTRGRVFGTGLLKSTDGGVNWTRVNDATLPESGLAKKIAVNPTNPDIVHLALFQTQNRTTDVIVTGGYYRSTNGGVAWTRVVSAPVRDLCIDPADGQNVFIAIMGGDVAAPAGVYRSTDGGATFTTRPYTSPHGAGTQDIRVAISPRDGQKLYAYAGGGSPFTLSLAASTDGGTTWQARSTTGLDPGQFGYNTYLAVWSGNSNVVFVGGRDVFRNDNNGTGTWANLTGSFDGASFGYTPEDSRIHPDQHAIAFSPTNDYVTYFGNDGGLYKSTDAGTSDFQSLNTSLALTQFVGFDVHPTNDAIMYGGSQDNGTQRRAGADGLTVWQEFANGDGGNVVIDPSRDDRVFATYIRGTILRYTNHTGTENGTLFSDSPDITNNATFGEPATSPRIAFYPPLTSNRTDGALYFGTWRLFVSTDAGATWTPPGGSFDLTNGGSDVLSAIGVQKSGYSNSQTIYTGSSRGRVMVSTDGGANWTERISGLPTRFITSIKVSPTNAATAYLSVSGFGTGHVYKTTNSGATWTNVSGTLPNIPANDIAFWSFDSQILYVATDIGIFISRDGGASWQDYSNGLPPVIVTKLDNLDNGKLFASTYGRGAYEFTIVDCNTSLSNYNADAPAAGGGFSVQQTGTDGCPWTAVANDSWITVTQGASGNGPGQITFTVAANTGAAREGTIYLRGGVNTLVLTVRQQGSPCANALALTPATAEWNEYGGTAFFDVSDGGNNCPWTAHSNVSWLTITQGASGTGPGRIVYQVAENNAGTGRRSGSITVNNRTFNVSQDGPIFYTWTGATMRDDISSNNSNSWDTAANWSPYGVPGVKDTATISNGDLVTLSNAVRSVRSLNLTGGTLTNALLTVTGASTWTGGKLATVTLKIAEGGKLSVGGASAEKWLEGATIENRGEAEWVGGNGVILYNGFWDNYGTFRSNHTADGGTMFSHYSGTNRFTNLASGRFIKSAGADTTDFANSGNIDFRNYGEVGSASGTLRFAHGMKLYTGSSVEGAARTLVSGGTLYAYGETAIGLSSSGVFEFAGGTLAGGDAGKAGSFTDDGAGAFKWTGGTITGSLNVGSKFLIENSTVERWLNSALVTASGVTTWRGGDITFYNGTFTNSGTFYAEGDNSVLHYSGANRFANTGTLIKRDSTGTTRIGNSPSINFDNSGAVQVQSGTLALSSGASSGSFTAAGADTFIDFYTGTHTLNTGANFSGAGRTRVNGGNVTGTGSFSGTLHVAGGTLGGTNTVTTGSTLAWSGGTISGTMTVPGEANLNITHSATEKWLTSGTINNAGTMTWTGLSSVTMYGGTINNSGTFRVATDGTVLSHYSGSNGFNNTGIISKIGGAADGIGDFTNSSAIPVSNNGTLHSAVGTLRLDDQLNLGATTTVAAGAGRVLISGGSTTLAGTLAALGDLEISGGTLTGTSADAAITGAGARWTGGTLSGTLTIPEGSQLNITGGEKWLTSVTLNNAGTILWNAAAPIMKYNSTLNNAGTFRLLADGLVFNHYSGTNLFANTGTLVKAAGAGATDFTNSAAIPVTHSGTINVETGTLVLNDVLNLREGARIAGVGRVLMDGGTTNLQGAATIVGNLAGTSNFVMSGGTFAGASAGSLAGADGGALLFTGGTLTGTVNVSATGGRLQIADGAEKWFSHVTFNNAGALTWTGTNSITQYNASFNNTGVFTAASTGRFEHYSGTNNVSNSGTLDIGDSGIIGRLRLAGGVNFTNTTSGVINLDVASTDATTGYDAIEASAATLGGTLNLRALGSFVAESGNTFRPLAYGSRTNQFATISLALGRHREYTPTYGASNLTLATVVNLPFTSAPTATGSNVTIASDTPNDAGTVGVTFNSVSTEGTTTFTGIDPHSAGAAPAGMTIPDNYPAQEITTTATIGAPVTVTFNVSDLNLTQDEFDRLRVLHGENGVLVNRTVARNFAAGTITARVTSLSPFIVARTNLPPVKLTPAADTWVQGAEAFRNTNYGASTEMQVKRTFNAGSGRGRRGFLRFDTSSVAGEVAGARLRLFARLTDANLPSTPMIIQKVTDTTWSEMTMTWNNQPLTASPNALAQITVIGAGGAWYEFDLTDFIRAERAAGRATVSFRLINVTATGNSGVFFTTVNTKEAATNQPYLSIEQ